MRKKILKVFTIILVVIFVISGIAIYLLKDQFIVMDAVLTDNKNVLSHYIDEKGFNPNKLYGNINLYKLYIHNNKDNINLDFIEFMLKKNINTLSGNKEDMPVMLYVIAHNKPDIVKLLINYGDNVNMTDIKGITPLGAALRVNNCQIAKILIDSGAKLSDKELEIRILEQQLNQCEEDNWISEYILSL